jgi:dephospho-CoA kinase
MIKVVITGGIGSGKSTVCKVFEKLGIPVFNADAVAKSITNNNKYAKSKLIDLFGNSIYHSNGVIHRKKLADIIFNNNIALQKVNKIIHPLVFEEFENWSLKQTTPYVVQESAIVFENKNTLRFDKIITVTSPVEIRIERCMKRDSISREQIEERMKNQLSDDEKIALSDFVIVNDNTEMILPQILNIHNKLI